MSKVFPIFGAVQSYDWGAIGSSSKVAQFAKLLPDFQLDEGKPYAELWMGTHPNLPSKLSSTNQSLVDLLKQHPDLLGDAVVKKYGDGLPFLFKVLAIGKALSIQAHPDKVLGAKLHKERPDVYKDPNHKPEMAIALSDFSGFCGFRPLQEIAKYLETVPELAAVVGKSSIDTFTSAVSSCSNKDLLKRNSKPSKESPAADTATLQKALKGLFASLMEADAEKTIKPELQKLVKRYQQETGSTESKSLPKGSIEELVLRLNEQFPDDIGCFCSYLLNVVTLKPGQACFLQANEPHAYLTDIMECMATSDNVVRAGLTPKLRDVPTLIDMLTYTWGPPSTQLMQPQSYANTQHATLYDPPIDEFSVLLIDLTKGGKEETLPAIDGPSILIVTALDGKGKLEVDGESLDLDQPGQTFFIGANAQVKLSGSLVAYKAFVEVA